MAFTVKHDELSYNLEIVKENRKVSNTGTGRVVGGKPFLSNGPLAKINFSNMVDELRLEGQPQNENKFVEKLLKRKIPSRDDAYSCLHTDDGESEKFINSIIKNMTKSIIYLYKNIDTTIDEYLVSKEDKFAQM